MKPPAFQFYADDFLSGTFHMTDEEVGQYIRLLCRQWSGCGLVGTEMASHTRSTEVSPRVLSKFERCEDGLFRNRRMELERSKQAYFRKLQSVKGKKSAESRLNSGSNRNPTAVQPNVNLRSPSPSPSTEEVHGSTAVQPEDEINQMLRVLGDTIYGRPEPQAATIYEARLAFDVTKRPDWKTEMETILGFGRVCKPADRQFEIPKTLERLLEQWSGTLDKARNYNPHASSKTHPRSFDRNSGTANEGKSNKYAGVGEVGRVRNPPGSAT